MKKVVIESPYAGDRKKNMAYLEACILDSLNRGESPYASHGLYPSVLDDNDPEQRALGIHAGLEWGDEAELRVVCIDLGISVGMGYGIDRAREINQPIELRPIPGWEEELYQTMQDWILIEGLKTTNEEKVKELLQKYGGNK